MPIVKGSFADLYIPGFAKLFLHQGSMKILSMYEYKELLSPGIRNVLANEISMVTTNPWTAHISVDHEFDFIKIKLVIGNARIVGCLTREIIEYDPHEFNFYGISKYLRDLIYACLSTKKDKAAQSNLILLQLNPPLLHVGGGLMIEADKLEDEGYKNVTSLANSDFETDTNQYFSVTQEMIDDDMYSNVETLHPSKIWKVDKHHLEILAKNYGMSPEKFALHYLDKPPVGKSFSDTVIDDLVDQELSIKNIKKLLQKYQVYKPEDFLLPPKTWFTT